MRHVVAAVALLAAVACSGDDAGGIAYGTVVAGEVTQTVAAPATIQPHERATVTAPATGVVDELLVADGDRVRAGDVVARLGSPSLAQQIEQAEAAVAAAGALGSISATTDLSPLLELFADSLAGTIGPLLDALDAQAGQISDDGARAEAQASLAEARRQYYDTLNGLQRTAADARVSAEQSDAAQRAVAEAQGAQAQAALDALEGQQERLEIVAPIDGTVELARGDGVDVSGGLAGDLGDLAGLAGAGASGASSARLAEGAEVSAGQVLLAIFDLSSFHAAAQVDEVDVIELEVGQAAAVLADALADTVLTGRVDWIAIEPSDGGTGVTYDVIVSLVEVPDSAPLRVGLTASVEIDVATVTTDTVVPTSALLRRGGQEIVFVRRDGIAVEVPVSVVAIGLDTAAVEGDLEEGDEVVVQGVELLADGDELP